MTSTTLPYVPSKNSQKAIIAFYQECIDLAGKQYSIREALRKIDLAYMRELDWTDDSLKAKWFAQRGDPTKFENVILPVVMPQVEAATAYQMSVFLTGHPIFSAVTRPGLENIALQIDAVVEDQQIRGDWITEFSQAFRDGYKYNLLAMETDWKRKTTFAPDSGTLKELQWQGNVVKRLDLYNTFFDTRVVPRKIAADGEFAGYVEPMSRIALKRFLDSLPYNFNVTEAFESGGGSNPMNASSSGYDLYYHPAINEEAGIIPTDRTSKTDTNWLAWAGLVEDSRRPNIEYQNSYMVSTLYGRIIPTDFAFRGVPGTNTPQVWKFIIVNGSVVVYAERLTNAHDMLPITLAQPLDDGLGYQTKSFAQNLAPIQSITSAIANSTIAGRRRAIADRMLYDSARISAAHINSDQPVARIPVRPSVSGQDLRAAIYQIPFEDSQFQINQSELQGYMNYANMISGLNPTRQGQFVKGNKTRYEFAETMGNANARDQLVSLGLEGSLMTPVKEIIKINIFQYQPPQTILFAARQQEVEVDPVALREANISFKMSDGLIPADKLIDGESLESALQAMAQNPAIAQGYNITPAFSYLMKSRGADLTPFEKSQQQMAYEQATMQWQQAMAQIAESLKGMDPEAAQQLMQSAPPQPTPEQFGYDPSLPPQAQTGQAVGGTRTSILDQVTQAMQAETGERSALGEAPPQGNQASAINEETN